MQKIIKLFLNSEALLLATFLLVVASLAWNTIGTLDRNYELQQQVDGLRAEIELLQLQNDTLALQNEYYKTTGYLELAAKDQLNKVRPGERVALLPKDGDSGYQDEASSASELPEQSNLEQWLLFLFGNRES